MFAQVGKAHCKVRTGSKGGQVMADVEAILADFQLMGEGLVKNIETLTLPSSNTSISM